MPIILAVVLIIGAFLTGGAIQERVQQSQSPTPTLFQEIQVPTASPTLTPTPTPKPIVKGATTNLSPTMPPSPKPTDFDPIVDCGTDWQKQGGEAIKVTKSFCDSLINCELGFGIAVRVTRDQCNSALRQAEEIKKQKEGMVKCETKDGWVSMKKEACTAYQEQWRKEKTAEIVEEVKSKLHQDTLQQLENELKQKGYTPEEIEKHKQEFDKYIKEQGSIPMPTPCICIESWGAGGFKGYCRDKAHCIIKYSCLLPDKKRLGVWNDDQTVCLEEHVRYAGQYEGQ